MARQSRTRPANPEEARHRARAAHAYVELAQVALDGSDPAMRGAAVGNAVLAEIAAADAICARRLQVVHRGDDHRAAAHLLSQATPDGAKLAATFRRLIDLKDEAHYGLTKIPATKARDAVGWALSLVNRAQEEVER